jgi:putative ABC transport system substrate-binding protein
LLGQPNDAYFQTALAAFVQGLQQAGWIEKRNLQFDTRWAAGNAEDIRKYAAELVALAPDVIMVSGSASANGIVPAQCRAEYHAPIGRSGSRNPCCDAAIQSLSGVRADIGGLPERR